MGAVPRWCGVIARWWDRRRQLRRARAHLRAAIRDPACRAGTSLRAEHIGRVSLTDIEMNGDVLAAFTFTILRHPRPYRFSNQHHLVMQQYRFDVAARRISHLRSINLSREAGGDGNPAGSA